MPQIITEYSKFNESERDYPYTFDFFGNEGKYRLDVAANYEDFRITYPNGEALTSSKTLVSPGASVDSVFGDENGVLLYFIQQQFFDQSLPHVTFDQRFDFSTDRVRLTIVPSRQLCSLSLPEGKVIYFRTTADRLIGKYFDNNRGMSEWIATKIYETNFFYVSLLGGRSLYESKLSEFSEEESQHVRNNGIIASKIETAEDEYYQIVCDKEKDIIVVYHPARCIPTTSDRFFIDVDGIIGLKEGKIESFYLDKLRQAGFNMKSVLASRLKAMEIIDAWRQKEI